MGTNISRNIQERRDVQDIMDSIRAIVRALRVSTRDYEKACGLNGAQIFILQQIRAGNRITVNELADRTFTHQSTISESLGRLVRLGLVVRNKSRKDARRVEVELTPKGKLALKGTPKTAQEELAIAIQSFSPQNRKKLAGILSILVKNAGWEKKTPPLFFESEKKRRTPRV